ncbi:aminotransferase class I/II-fold pyridoxal phosphate-dependent enzyme [Sorangium sp. So ce315]|uniref:DegT/DnrJ/EryC1/StrS family aminotransferase n=1 Tax=Sorangium sp. So ce315 TaxID=3133299 RepID=UPI003F613F04
MSDQRPFIPMVLPQVEDPDAIAAQLAGVLRSGRLTNGGPFTEGFEEAIAAFLGVEEAVVVSNGAVAISLAIEAAAVPRGKAILPAFTFIATLNAAVHAGFEPVFCDIDPETWTMDPEHLRRLLASHGATLVLPVNVFGVPPDLAAIARQARAAGAAVIYDDAHGMGTEAASREADALLTATTYSLHATKVLVAAEGGVVVAPDRAVSAAMRRLRNHGLAQPLTASVPGMNAKIDELRAALALASLRRLPEALARRRTYLERLRGALARHPHVYCAQRIPPGVRPNGQNLGVRLVDAPIEDAIAAFARRGVEARRYFYPPLHELSCLPPAGVALPHTDRLCAGQVCLPLHGRMSEETLERLEAAIHGVAEELEAPRLAARPARQARLDADAT